jgi:hypothetical protein
VATSAPAAISFCAFSGDRCQRAHNDPTSADAAPYPAAITPVPGPVIHLFLGILLRRYVDAINLSVQRMQEL